MVLPFPVLVLCAILRDMTRVIGGSIFAQGRPITVSILGFYLLFSSPPADFITDTGSMHYIKIPAALLASVCEVV